MELKIKILLVTISLICTGGLLFLQKGNSVTEQRSEEFTAGKVVNSSKDLKPEKSVSRSTKIELPESILPEMQGNLDDFFNKKATGSTWQKQPDVSLNHSLTLPDSKKPDYTGAGGSMPPGLLGTFISGSRQGKNATSQGFGASFSFSPDLMNSAYFLEINDSESLTHPGYNPQGDSISDGTIANGLNYLLLLAASYIIYLLIKNKNKTN